MPLHLAKLDKRRNNESKKSKIHCKSKKKTAEHSPDFVVKSLILNLLCENTIMSEGCPSSYICTLTCFINSSFVQQ